MKTHTFYWVLPISLILITYGNVYECLSENNIPQYITIIKSFGYSLFSGSVFAVILKSDQFSTIFQDQLRQIIFTEENLSNRKDLSDIWDKVTASLCEQKFKIISKQLHKRIKDHYLPIDHEFYYKEFRSDIELRHHEIEGYLNVTENVSMNLVSAHSDKITIPFSVVIDKDQSDTKLTSYELLELNINSVKQDLKDILKIEKNDTELIVTGKFDVSTKKNYNISRKEEKTYMLKHNSLRIHHANWLYKNAELNVRYPSDLKIKLLGMGLLNKFSIDESYNNGDTILKAKYSGLIFKNQGFILHISKIN